MICRRHFIYKLKAAPFCYGCGFLFKRDFPLHRLQAAERADPAAVPAAVSAAAERADPAAVPAAVSAAAVPADPAGVSGSAAVLL